MPNLYNNYCYADITSAANASLGDFIPVGSYLVWPSLTSVSGNVATFTINAKNATTTAATTTSGTLSRTFPSCTDVGYLSNYSGLTITDVVSVSWLVVLAWSMAWAFKNMRRAL